MCVRACAHLRAGGRLVADAAFEIFYIDSGFDPTDIVQNLELTLRIARCVVMVCGISDIMIYREMAAMRGCRGSCSRQYSGAY